MRVSSINVHSFGNSQPLKPLKNNTSEVHIETSKPQPQLHTDIKSEQDKDNNGKIINYIA